jgi:AraC-like DNA-binding protein
MSAFIDLKPVQPQLQRFIESYRVIYGEKEIHAKEIVPRPAATLIFDADGMIFNDTLTLQDPLLGLHTVPVNCRTIVEMRRCLVIKFGPYGLSSFTDKDISLLTNQVISAGKLFGDEINGLLLLLTDLGEPAKLIEKIEAWLISHYHEPDPVTLMIADLADGLRAGLNTAAIKILKQKIPLGERQLQRIFRSMTGINMKAFSRLCKFERAQQLLEDRRNTDLNSVSFESGYYDQAHFTRDFKAGTAFSPGNYDACAVKK